MRFTQVLGALFFVISTRVVHALAIDYIYVTLASKDGVLLVPMRMRFPGRSRIAGPRRSYRHLFQSTS
jgi:hypothetical protein